MEHLPVELTEQQRSNLKKLADYLLHGVRGSVFTMRHFDIRHTRGPGEVTCGTAGCAVGHGPYAGIPKLEPEKWTEYSRREFINDNSFTGIKAWDFCFHSIWSGHDNTAEGAARRLLYLLEHGVPIKRQMNITYIDYSIKY